MSRMNGSAAEKPEEHDGGEAGDTDVADAQGHSNKHDHRTTAAAGFNSTMTTLLDPKPLILNPGP